MKLVFASLLTTGYIVGILVGFNICQWHINWLNLILCFPLLVGYVICSHISAVTP